MFLRRTRSRLQLAVAVLVLLVAGAAGAATAGEAAGTPAAEAPRPGGSSSGTPQQWYGRVLAQGDLAPVAGVRIFVEPVLQGGLLADLEPTPDSVEDAVTGPDGAFVLDAPPDRRLRLTAPGFLDGFVLLRAGRGNDLGRLILRHELSFGGRVLLDGRPEVGVVVLAPAYRRNSVAGTPTPETVSDDAGRFHLVGLRPEQFRELVFIARGVAESREMARLDEPLEPRHYELGDIDLLARVNLRGTVVDAGGEAVAGAAVSISYSDSMRLPKGYRWEETRIEDRFQHEEAVSDERGEFSLVVAPGEHSLQVFHPTAGLSRTTVRVKAGEPETHAVHLALQPPLSIRGRVVDIQGNAIAGVVLESPGFVRGEPNRAMQEYFYRAVTGEDGCYTMRVPHPGAAFFDAHLVGYASRRMQVDVPDRPPVPQGGNARSADGRVAQGCDDVSPIVLSPGAQLRGRVTNQLGEVVADATVSAERHQHPGGYFGPAEIPPVTTGDDGSFVLDGLPFGDYSLFARAPGHAYRTVDNLAIGPLPTDAGADRVDELLAASPLTKAPGAEVYALDVTLQRLVPNVEHEVVVFDARGVPEPEARVSPWLRDGDPEQYGGDAEDVFTGADGRAVFPELLPGTYTMTARAPESHDYGSVRTDDHQVRAEGLPTILTMPEPPPLGELRGRYVDADGRGIAGAVVHASGTFRRRRNAHTVTAPDGTFRFDGLPYGRYVLKAERAGLPGVVHPQPIAVDAPVSGPLKIVVPAFGAIEGFVSGLRADEPGIVTVFASSQVETEGGARQSIEAQTRAAEDGAFRIAGLAPGTWNLHVSGLNDRGVDAAVELAEGEVRSGVELALPPGFTLTGTITWRGEPPERAWISGAGRYRGMELSDPTVFELRDVQPGEQQIEVGPTGLRSPYFVYTRVEGDGHIDIVIAGGAVNGRVVDATSGAPIGGARVHTDPIPQLVWDAHEESRRADRNGVFTAGPFPAGPWRFEVWADGYAPRAPEIDIGAVDIDDYVIEMQPTRDLEIRLLGPPELDAERLYAAWYDAATGEVVSTQYLPVIQGETAVRWPDGPTGRGFLSVTAARMDLAARVEVEIGDEPVEVTLEPTGGIEVVVPELAGHRPIFALLRVFDDQGRPVPDSFATSHRMFRQREGPQQLVSNLVPGRYRIEVETSDGRSWSGEAEVRAYEDSELVLR